MKDFISFHMCRPDARTQHMRALVSGQDTPELGGGDVMWPIFKHIHRGALVSLTGGAAVLGSNSKRVRIIIVTLA